MDAQLQLLKEYVKVKQAMPVYGYSRDCHYKHNITWRCVEMDWMINASAEDDSAQFSFELPQHAAVYLGENGKDVAYINGNNVRPPQYPIVVTMVKCTRTANNSIVDFGLNVPYVPFAPVIAREGKPFTMKVPSGVSEAFPKLYEIYIPSVDEKDSTPQKMLSEDPMLPYMNPVKPGGIFNLVFKHEDSFMVPIDVFGTLLRATGVRCDPVVQLDQAGEHKAVVMDGAAYELFVQSARRAIVEFRSLLVFPIGTVVPEVLARSSLLSKSVVTVHPQSLSATIFPMGTPARTGGKELVGALKADISRHIASSARFRSEAAEVALAIPIVVSVSFTITYMFAIPTVEPQ